MTQLNVIIILYVLGLLAIVVELFIPGIIVGTLGFLAIVASIVYALSVGRTWMAIAMITCSVLLTPVFFMLWKGVLVKYFANTRVQSDYRPSSTVSEDLEGLEGVAVTPLHPSGIARLNEKRYDVVTEGEMLEKGTPIVVTDVSGNRIVVRRVE
ncbi:MAG: hypothetical protein J7M08_00310 [Planctomycetes bacterium]|nr:hypothetical protein [Planctomycetota bacterium]